MVLSDTPTPPKAGELHTIETDPGGDPWCSSNLTPPCGPAGGVSAPGGGPGRFLRGLCGRILLFFFFAFVLSRAVQVVHP